MSRHLLASVKIVLLFEVPKKIARKQSPMYKFLYERDRFRALILMMSLYIVYINLDK